MRRVLIAAVAVFVLLLAAAPPPAYAATDEIRTSATSVYTAVPGKNQVRVSVTMKITNRIPSTATLYYYVDQTRVWVEDGAKSIKVTTDAGGGALKLVDNDAGFRSYDVRFPRILLGQTRTITLTYVLPGGAPRSPSTDRVNTAYLNFWAITQPTDTASVKIVVPKAFDIETSGGDVTSSTKGSTRVFSSGNVDDPGTYWVGVAGTNLAGFDKQTITTADGRRINVLGWPGDDAWMSAVRGEAAASIPTLVKLVGQPLPGSGAIDIRETAGSDLGDAYIASFDEKEQLARVSEDYSQDGAVTHELSHAWFNDTFFDSRWMSEGYASWIEHASGSTDEPCPAPGKYPAGRNPNLGFWQFASPRATADELAMVAYQYDAACTIVTKIADQVGLDRMRAVIGVLATADGPYEGVPDATADKPVGWRDWLDAVDELGMRPAGLDDTHTASDLLVTYGIATRAALAERIGGREALDELRATTTGWAVPLAVLRPMATWDFEDAQAAMAEAEAIVALAGEVEDTLVSADADSGPIHTAYEAATDAAALATVHAEVSDQLDAAKAVADAVAASGVKRGFIEELGLAEVDLPALADAAVSAVEVLDTATARAKAGEVTTAVAQASDKGTTKVATVVGIAVAVLLALVALTWMLRRRRGKARREIEGLALAAEPAPESGTTPPDPET